MTTAELERLVAELRIDVIGAAPAGAYEKTERAIRERRARALFAGMRAGRCRLLREEHDADHVPPRLLGRPRDARHRRRARAVPAAGRREAARGQEHGVHALFFIDEPELKAARIDRSTRVRPV